MDISEMAVDEEIKILFVDDEPDILEQAEIFLERENENLNVFTAKSAEEALSSLEEDRFDIVVSDYKMPEKDGLDFLKELREDGRDIPFIFLTGKGEEEVAMKALNLGADRYFRKGTDPDSQYSLISGAIMDAVQHERIEERNEFLQNFLKHDLKNKARVVDGNLESLSDMDLPEDGREHLKKAIEANKEGLDLIDRVDDLTKVEDDETGEKKGTNLVGTEIDVLGTFLGHAWTEAQLKFTKMWRAYKTMDSYKDPLFRIARDSAEQKSLLKRIGDNLEGFDMARYIDSSESEGFSFEIGTREEIVEDLLDEEKFMLDVYENLRSLATKDMIENVWKGENPEDFFEIIDKLIEKENDHIDFLERAEGYMEYGIGPK